MSFIFIIGAWAWPRIECNRNFFRVIGGPFAFWLLFHDFEELLQIMQCKGIDFK